MKIFYLLEVDLVEAVVPIQLKLVVEGVGDIFHLNLVEQEVEGEERIHLVVEGEWVDVELQDRLVEEVPEVLVEIDLEALGDEAFLGVPLAFREVPFLEVNP